MPLHPKLKETLADKARLDENRKPLEKLENSEKRRRVTRTIEIWWDPDIPPEETRDTTPGIPMRKQALEYPLDPEQEKLDTLIFPLLSEDLTNLPPAYIMTMKCDPLRDEGEEYKKRLMDVNILCVTKRYDDLIHRYSVRENQASEIGGIKKLAC